MAAKSKSGSLHDFLRVAFRRKLLFLVSASLFAIAALVGSHFVPLKYTGKAIFEFGLEAAAEEISRTSKESFGTIKERLVHDLAGYQAVESAVRQLHLTHGLPHDREGRLTYEGQAALQQMVQRFMQSVQVGWESRSRQEDLVSVRFTHADPELAENMPNLLVKDYIDRTYERIRQGLKRQHDFLRSKAEDSSSQLDKAVREKIDFETRHAGMLPDNPSAFQEKIERARAELRAARSRHEIARLRLARLRALRTKGPTTAPAQRASAVVRQPNPELARLNAQLRDLQDELDSALVLRHMTKAHPTVRALEVKIAQTEKRIQETPLEIVKEKVFATSTGLLDLSMAWAGVQSELEATTNDITRIESLLAEYNKAWASFAPVRQGYLALLNKVDNSRAEAEHWRSRLESIQIALAAAMDNRLTRMKAIQPAQKQFLPTSPPLAAILTFAVVGSLLFAAGLVFLAKVLDRTLNTPEEAAERFALPIHGVIREIVTPAQRAGRLLKRWILAPAVTAVLLVVLAGSGTSAVFRLRRPQVYQQFRKAPIEFVQAQVHPVVEKVLDALKG
ncbi:MAG TPA: hypothetical protein VMZ50_12630 [Phycisphaerae bacterium]|nr:hypothetical protein [Phycisphaerae bacterium]